MREFMYVHLLSAVLVVLGLGNQPGPANVSRQQFRELRWIAGTWRGSGGAYPAFFEEYKVLDDSTIKMRSFSDSTLRVPTDSSMIEWRNGSVQSRSASRTYVVVTFTPSSVRFARPGAAAGGHTFTRVSADEWTATLHPAAAGGQPTVYTMRRIKR
jgi:hypothetical protein